MKANLRSGNHLRLSDVSVTISCDDTDQPIKRVHSGNLTVY